MNAFEIMEEIMNAIDKRYPKGSERNKELKDSAYKSKVGAEEIAKEHTLGKRPESAQIKGGWDIRTWEIPAETPEEREYSKKETDYDIKQIRKEFTKNKTGEHETKKKQFPKSYKDVGVLGEPDAKELETERTARKALGKRKAKMNKNEALEIMEEIKSIVEGRKEGESLEEFKKRLGNEQFDKQYDKYIDATKKVIYSDQHDRKHRPHKGMSQRTHELEKERDKAFSNKELASIAASGAKSWPQHSKSRDQRKDEDYVNLQAEMRAKNKTNEALELIESILSYADNLFELDYEEKQNISPNEISRVKKNKKGEKVEVVSVADELFPYEGDAKQQFNQKVLAKINDMIEGTGSLEDLIQFVRAGAKAKASKAHEALDEDKEPNKECEYRKGEWDKAVQNYYDTKKKHLDWEGEHPETKKAYDEERKAYANLDKARRDSKKINGPFEALEEIKNVAEGLFKKDERGDLLDDIDTALGSPVKKKLADIKAKMTGCKQTKVHEDMMNLIKELLNESNPEAIQKVANKRAYDAGYHSQKQFNNGEVTLEGKRAQKKFAKIKELIRKREDRTGDWAVKHSELADNCNKGWEDSKK